MTILATNQYFLSFKPASVLEFQRISHFSFLILLIRHNVYCATFILLNPQSRFPLTFLDFVSPSFLFAFKNSYHV